MVSVAIRNRPFTYSHTIGLLSLTAKGFSNPVDMTLGDDGVMYVVNRSNSYQALMGAVPLRSATSRRSISVSSQGSAKRMAS